MRVRKYRTSSVILPSLSTQDCSDLPSILIISKPDLCNRSAVVFDHPQNQDGVPDSVLYLNRARNRTAVTRQQPPNLLQSIRINKIRDIK